MGIAGRHPRRSIRILIIGAALVALLAVAGNGVALGADDTDVGISTTSDVYIRDTDGDIGLQSHGFSPWWSSPDIKVCVNPTPCATTENAIAGAMNYIFVTLRNPGPYGTNTASGTLWIHWTPPGSAMDWPGSWLPIGMASTTVPAWTTKTVMVPWAVSRPGAYHLLAQWVSPTDPPYSTDSTLSPLVPNNNNFALRGVNAITTV